jgi:peptidoglycan/LPS O-acetylase OafA/YrhL
MSCNEGHTVKAHFETLDGLRGVAAISVLLFHWSIVVCGDVIISPIRHAFMAVDFFFMLSGFVVAHAYQNRLKAKAPDPQRLTIKGFLLRRLIRLHPLVVLSLAVGALTFAFDPFAYGTQTLRITVPFRIFAIGLILQLLLLPAPPLPNREGVLYPLNNALWTLFQEYVASFFYGVIGHRLGVKVIGALCVVTGIALIVVAGKVGYIGFGYTTESFGLGFLRMAFPFLMGMLLHRLNLKLRLKHAFVWLSLALMAVFMAPYFGAVNGYIEGLCVVLIFPLIVMAGAAEVRIEGRMGHLCRFLGRISYPLYVLHFPMLDIYTSWVWNLEPSFTLMMVVGGALMIGIIALSWLVLIFYDEPVRAWLARKAASL